jgi:hypothetical protein
MNTRHYISEDTNVCSHSCENLKIQQKNVDAFLREISNKAKKNRFFHREPLESTGKLVLVHYCIQDEENFSQTDFFVRHFTRM